MLDIKSKHARLPYLRGRPDTRSPNVRGEVCLPCRSEVQEMRTPRDSGPVVSVPFRKQEPLPPLREFSCGKTPRGGSHRPDVQESAQLLPEVFRRQSALVPILPA